MSFPGISKKGASEFRALGGAASHLKVSFAVFNKNANRWVAPQLDAAEEIMLKSVIDSLQKTGDPRLRQMLSEGEAIIQITQEGIKIQKGGRWVDLLADKEISRKTKVEIKKTLGSVKQVLGDLSKTRQKIESGGVRISMQSAPLQEVFLDHYRKIYEFFEAEEQSFQQLESAEWQEYLKLQGIPEQTLARFTQEHTNLLEASREVAIGTAEVGRLLQEGRVEEAYGYYFDLLEKLGYYYDCLTTFEAVQSHVLGQLSKAPDFDPYNLPFSLQLNIKERVHFHTVAFKEFMLLARRQMPEIDRDEAREAIEYIERLDQNYRHVRQFYEVTKKKFAELSQQEFQFKNQVDNAVRAFKDPQLISFMKEHGFSSEECDEYLNDLKELHNVASSMDKWLQWVNNQVSQGSVQEALEEYAEGMTDFLKGYQQLAEKMVMWQKLANDRLPDRLAPFNLNLNRADRHADMLQLVLEYADNHPMSYYEGTPWVKTENWSACLHDVKAHAAAVKQAETNPPFSRELSSFLFRIKTNAEQIEPFVKKFSQDRKGFESLMRASGYSDLETAYLCNHLEKAYQALDNWKKGLQKVVDLANRKKYKEAMDLYAALVQAQYPAFIEAMETMVLVSPQWEQTVDLHHDFRDPIEQFMLGRRVADIEVGPRRKEAQKLIENLWSSFLKMKNLPFQGDVNFSEALKSLEKEGIEPSESWMQALQKIKETNESLLVRLQEKQYLYKPGPSLLSFFHLNLNRGQQQAWIKTLKAYGWSEKDAIAMDKIMDAYAKEIEPLRQAEIAIENEPNEDKKRILRAQLRKLASEAMPRLATYRSQLRKLGGIRQILSLEEAFQAFTATRKDLTASTMQDLQQIIGGAIQLNYDRLLYTDKLYEDLNLMMPLDRGGIERRLLHFPHASDPKWREILLGNGDWHAPEITKLSKLYDRYLEGYEAIHLAKAELDQDPNNRLLQEEFYRISSHHLPRLGAIIKELNKMGGMQRLKELDWAALVMFNSLEQERERIQEILSNPRLRPNERMGFEQDLHRLNTSIDMLSKVTFSSQFESMDKEMAALSNLAKRGFDWDKSYFEPLFSKASPIVRLSKGSVWSKILKNNNLNLRKIEEVNKLQLSYQKELSEMERLNDKLKSSPANAKLQKELLVELRKRAARLKQLENRYEELSNDIAHLQEAVKDLNNDLKESLEEIERQEGEIKQVAGITQTDLQKRLQEYRQTRVGGLATKDLRALIDLSDGIKVIDAFENKRRVMFQLYTEYHLLDLLQH